MDVNREAQLTVNSNQQWRRDALRLGAAWGMIVLLLAMSGCGWLFKKQGKDMTVNVEITGTDSLNHDGQNAQAVEVRAYVLKDSHRFNEFNTQVFFNPLFDKPRLDEFYKKDTLATSVVYLTPGETKKIEMIIPYAYARDSKPEFAVIANFFNPPLNKTERLAFEMKKKTSQTLHITVGKDWVSKD